MDAVDISLIVFIVAVFILGAGGFIYYNYTDNDLD